MVLRTKPTVRVLNVLRHPITIVLGGTGIFNLFPIAYAFLPELRGRLTQGRRPLPWKPSAYGEEDFHFLYRYSCHALSLVYAPVLLAVHLQCRRLRSPTAYILQYKPAISVLCLVPEIIGAKSLDW